MTGKRLLQLRYGKEFCEKSGESSIIGRIIDGGMVLGIAELKTRNSIFVSWPVITTVLQSSKGGTQYLLYIVGMHIKCCTRSL